VSQWYKHIIPLIYNYTQLTAWLIGYNLHTSCAIVFLKYTRGSCVKVALRIIIFKCQFQNPGNLAPHRILFSLGICIDRICRTSIPPDFSAPSFRTTKDCNELDLIILLSLLVKITQPVLVSDYLAHEVQLGRMWKLFLRVSLREFTKAKLIA